MRMNEIEKRWTDRGREDKDSENERERERKD